MNSAQPNPEPRSHVVILGGGLAGLTLAWQLLRRSDLKTSVTILEQDVRVGGIAGSFEVDGIHLDYGSHRLHPATDPRIMADIRALLGEDLLRRPRNGRIRLMNRFVKFPLNPLDLAIHLPPAFVAGVVRDSLLKPFKSRSAAENFSDALLRGLGATVCHRFYFPYARKLWGLDPGQIAVEQAQKRVSANSLRKILRRALAILPGLKPPGAGVFYYPRKGFGQIAHALAREIQDTGGRICLRAPVRRVCRLENGRFRVEYAGDPGGHVEADLVFSTISMPHLVRMLQPEPPPPVRASIDGMRSRAMVFVYLVLGQSQFTPYDAHYFPEPGMVASRMSEPKNYAAAKSPADRTILCYEIPCAEGDEIWNASAETLRDRILADMTSVGLPICTLEDCFLRRHPGVYPVYERGFARHFQVVDEYLSGCEGLVSLGRQGLFAHDNAHHAMQMGYCAAECLDSNLVWNRRRWAEHRVAFDAHVIED